MLNYQRVLIIEQPTPASRRCSFVLNGLSGAPGHQGKNKTLAAAPRFFCATCTFGATTSRYLKMFIPWHSALVMGFLPKRSRRSLSLYTLVIRILSESKCESIAMCMIQAPHHFH